MSRAYVGFYWTLPVPRRGFRTLPHEVDAAARKSRTIRYQLEQVRRYVAEDRGRLVGEAAFMEIAPDRGTRAVEEELAKVAALCTAHQATLLYVRFSEAFFWRPHAHLLGYLDEHAVPNLHLPPDPVMIDGRVFDPVKHFRRWQRRHDSETRETRQNAKVELAAVMARLPDTPGRYQAAADALNEQGVTTATGLLWTAEGVRKAYKRRASTQAPASTDA